MSKQTKEALAYALAEDAHEGQKYGEHDYFHYHVLGVASEFSKSCIPNYELVDRNCIKCGNFGHESNNECKSYDHEEYIVALLHHVVEDSGLEISIIFKLFGSKIAVTVQSITRFQLENYNEYIIRLSKNYLATKVKIAAIKFHLSQAVIRNEEKYRKALAYLEDVT